MGGPSIGSCPDVGALCRFCDAPGGWQEPGYCDLHAVMVLSRPCYVCHLLGCDTWRPTLTAVGKRGGCYSLCADHYQARRRGRGHEATIDYRFEDF